MERFRIPRILLGIALLVAALVSHSREAETAAFLLSLASLIVGGSDVIFTAARNLKTGQIFDENFLMSIAAIGAFCIGEGAEGAAVMLFYQVGEYFQDRAVDSARKSIADLMDIRPDYANLLINGESIRTDPFDIDIGAEILVRPGEKIPLDGIVLTGESAVDTAALTGESAPRNLAPGDDALSGCINLNGVLTISVTKPFSESTASKILDLVENAAIYKSKTEAFITRFARVYTPAVTIAALFLAVIPSLVTGNWSLWIYRALSFLVVSCPCALVISVPMSFFGGIGAASKHGILVKGGNYLEALAHTSTVVMDKTGTLTKGRFAVQQVLPAEGFTAERLLSLAAAAEQHSSHPIAQALRQAATGALPVATELHEIAGQGVAALIDGQQVLVDNGKLLTDRYGIVVPDAPHGATAVYVSLDGQLAGTILIADELKDDAKQAISDLRTAGVEHIVMLSGDRQAVAAETAQVLGITQFYAGLLPAGKVSETEKLLAAKPAGSTLVFVGDGINDAPVLMRSDVGIAMGALGSDAAVEAADVVFMDDSPAKIAQAILLARATLRNARQNIVFSLAVKLGFLLLVSLGLVGMWAAVFADVGVALLAIFNAMRMLKK